MSELLAKLVPLLLVDALNPMLFALLLVALGTNRPMANSTALLAGHTAAYFCSGVTIALGIEQLTYRLEHPLPIDYIVELLLGLLCLWAALASRDGKASEEKAPTGRLAPLYCFGYGAIANFVGVPFALPYFAVVDQLLKADLSVADSLLVLAMYNAAYALPFALVPILVAVAGPSAKPFLEKVNGLLSRAVDLFMPVLMLLLGLALVADAISFLACGKGLW